MMPTMAPLPRFANRGLIEACDPRGLGISPRDFPDSRIGASLKRAGVRAGGTRRHHFPDSRIGASLKHATLSGMRD